MEKQFSREDASMKKWIKELPLEQPSPDFMQKVMAGVAHSAMKKPYQPLISRKVWVVIITLFILALLWIYFNPSSSIIDSEALSWDSQMQWNNPFEGMKIPKTAVYAIGFMALFLLQIPFLKRILDKSYI